MRNKIVTVIFDDGEVLQYKEKPIEFWSNKASADFYFRKQYNDFEEEVINSLHLNVEQYAIDKYNLIDEKKCDDSIRNFADYEIYEEAERRDLIKAIQEEGIQNVNIMNETFLDRFINIMNRGESLEIEKAIEKLESKFKIG